MESNSTPITMKPILPFLSHPNVELDGVVRHPIVEILNTVLADESVLAMKTRSAHWHANGPGFLDLRNLFDRQFHQLNMIMDHIAIRVRMLGGFAISSFEEFLNYTRLEEQPGEATNIMDLFADHETSIRCLNEDAQKCLEVYCDHETYALLVRFTRQHEMMARNLRSYIDR